ncbi:putative hydrolase of the HAD superfamily [Flavobacterium flevense]|uniref:Noncanonical pyrimidine nucleotidase, YjjG family protein n=1 Tax=Flavobacterium flevense TaxID=983 RepID=A0A4Y4AW99_9FLAO|nr:YjjG family noncanonical pyrimidine nucleotidase [Flavobacterium flevense]GEC72416.1 noncanonical pyrimidine nucleotidase, YjjG family protein [Flavobacterium flevense]SHL98105.1 putative hydrolase of the HAD superfamily [Flavobacterium flevense]
MRIENIKDVFFDLDHTLWDFDKNSKITFENIFARNHPAVLIESFITHYIPINQACWKLYQYDKITHQQLRYDRLKLSFDAIGYKITDEAIALISDEYIELLTENNHLFDGTVEILNYLSQKYKLHVITNGFAHVQVKKINNAKLNPYFATVTNSEMAGVKKPNPIIFEYALDLAKAKKESSIMIGDSIEADVLGALDAGIDAIYFNESRQDITHSVKQINHLLELKNYL